MAGGLRSREIALHTYMYEGMDQWDDGKSCALNEERGIGNFYLRWIPRVLGLMGFFVPNLSMDR